MKEYDALFDVYEHLKELPREAEALFLLRRAASLVKPIMRKRGWTVRTLAEFLPPDPRLQGLNINRTQKIFVRLRYTPDPKQFLPMEMIVDTLLHELSHIVWGPHDHNFQRLWDELRDEHQTLLLKGFTGEGFLSQGHKLGGKRMPLDEMRRQARKAAEKRRVISKGSGQKLGGSAVAPGTDIRKVIADAAKRRNSITEGCGSGSREVENAAQKQSDKSGFKTKSEEDDANDLAIMNALIELMEEEETRKLNEMYGTPSEDGGLTWTPENGLQLGEPVSRPSSTAPTSAATTPPPASGPSSNTLIDLTNSPSPQQPTTRSSPPQTTRKPKQNRPTSRLVAEDEARKSASRSNVAKKPAPNTTTNTTSSSSSSKAQTNPSLSRSQPRSNTSSASPPPPIIQHWTCQICTLENPLNYLCCEACGVERPDSMTELIAAQDRMRGQQQRAAPSKTTTTATSSSTAPRSRPAQQSGMQANIQSLGWNCRRCGSFMEHMWFTCSACGLMRD